MSKWRFVWGWPDYGWRMYGVIYNKSSWFLGLSVRIDRRKR